jgi:hypothetical protein
MQSREILFEDDLIFKDSIAIFNKKRNTIPTKTFDEQQ